MKRRTIACMTGTRADYPRVKSVLREIMRRPGLELKLIVTGMHLCPEYGMTVNEIEADGFPIAARVPMYDGDDTPYGMAKAVARCAGGIADALHEIKPDLFLITVDRAETLAAAQAGALMNFPMAHIQGGEVTGTIDESIRHAVTKLAQIHFPANQDAADRIVRMGEDPAMVHAVGCPYIDIIKSLELASKETLGQRYGFDPAKPLVLFTQHAVTTEFGLSGEQFRITLEALARFTEVEVIALHPNADAGGREILEALKRQGNFHVFANIHENDFLALMRHASVMVGNSSAAIREAPSFGLPAVNIGSRQSGRLRAVNVIDVPHDAEAIAKAIDKALNDVAFRAQVAAAVNPYGDGNSARRIVDILESVELSPALVQKIIRY